MPAAVAAAWQSHPDHPLVRLETAASGPGHAMSLQETPSDPCSTSATVILVDIALISVMPDALLRRSEAAEVRWKHIAIEPDGSGRLTIPWSKTDQEGEGVVLYLGPPTMKAVNRIRPRQQPLPGEERYEGEEKVFGLKPATISERIAAAALAAGLGEGYSGHSCRVGMAVDLAEAGATMPQLQAVGRWKASQTVARYVGAQFAGRSVVAQLYARKRKKKA